METNKDWDEGIPLVLFAIRETVQESLGFSPAELVFGHTVRGPLKILKDKMLETNSESETKNLDYVSRFRKRLHEACDLAQKSLKNALCEMKNRYDIKAVARSFQPGDNLLVLLPVQGSALSARFTSPYEVVKKLSETDYVIRTPERRRKMRVCHVNMLKVYHEREKVQCDLVKEIAPVVAMMELSVAEGEVDADEDGLVLRNTPQQCNKLDNSAILTNLSSHLSHLPDGQLAGCGRSYHRISNFIF